jgi:U3 small nucleolar RNA-associated protein 14
MMSKKTKYSLLWQAVLMVALQSIFLLAGSGLNSTAIALAGETAAAVQVQGVYVAHNQDTMSFRESDGVVRTYQVSATVRTIYTDGNEIDRRKLIFRTRCELKIVNDVIQEINVLEEPS